MSFNFHEDARSKRNLLKDTIGINYEDEDVVHPDFEMDGEGNTGKDRLPETWQGVGKKVLDFARNKVVVLMHDRAFKKWSGLAEANKLELFINYLRDLGVDFKTLDDFDP